MTRSELLPMPITLNGIRIYCSPYFEPFWDKEGNWVVGYFVNNEQLRGIVTNDAMLSKLKAALAVKGENDGH